MLSVPTQSKHISKLQYSGVRLRLDFLAGRTWLMMQSRQPTNPHLSLAERAASSGVIVYSVTWPPDECVRCNMTIRQSVYAKTQPSDCTLQVCIVNSQRTRLPWSCKEWVMRTRSQVFPDPSTNSRRLINLSIQKTKDSLSRHSWFYVSDNPSNVWKWSSRCSCRCPIFIVFNWVLPGMWVWHSRDTTY